MYIVGVWRDLVLRDLARLITRFLVEVKSCLVVSCDVSMMEREGEISIGDPPATFKSFVWQHFGFPVEIRNGERVTDKMNTICKHCKKTMPYTAANTSTMQKHIQNHHISLLKPAAHVTKTLKGQTTLNAVKCKSHGNNERHRRFHCSWYEAIFCGEKSGISATPPHTYIFILFILFIHFLCSISGNGLHYSCEIVQWRSQSVEFIAKYFALFACPLLHRIH